MMQRLRSWAGLGAVAVVVAALGCAGGKGVDCPECRCPGGKGAGGKGAGAGKSPMAKPSPEMPVLVAMPTVAFRPMTEAQAERLVELSLKCVGREYPNKPSDVQSGAKDVVSPRRLHPAFYGCFDWHSAVHGHWTMVRILKRFPKLTPAVAARIRSALRVSLTPARIRAEVAYFEGKHRRLFERPYGWGWLLRLAAELRTFDDPDGRRWAAALRPLEEKVVALVIGYLPRLTRPVRAGTHHNTAFALAHVRDYAVVAKDAVLRGVVDAAARRFYARDRECPTDYEPSGEDFVSPCLAEADLMRRVLPKKKEYRRWLEGFLPRLSSRRFRSLVNPPKVVDPKDAKLGHLVGLMFHRAWTMQGVAGALDGGDHRRATLEKLAVVHEYEGLRLVFLSGYGGAHWLASFAVFSLTDANR